MKFNDGQTHAGLVVEAVLLFGLVYFLIMSLIVPELYTIVEYIISFLFINLAFNNFIKDSKSRIGIAYLVCGIIILVAVRLTGGF